LKKKFHMLAREKHPDKVSRSVPEGEGEGVWGSEEKIFLAGDDAVFSSDKGNGVVNVDGREGGGKKEVNLSSPAHEKPDGQLQTSSSVARTTAACSQSAAKTRATKNQRIFVGAGGGRPGIFVFVVGGGAVVVGLWSLLMS
jgi:hypothetical protein